MKKTLLMAAVVLTALTMGSCRSSKTLSQATAVANPASQQAEEVAPIVYTNPQRTNNTQAPAPVAQPGDKTESVTVVNQADAGLLKNYNVVVGAFGSKANADNFRNKMIGRGYNSFLVQNPQGLYRVVAGGYDYREQAVQVRDQIRTTYANDDPGTCPMAWILIPAR